MVGDPAAAGAQPTPRGGGRLPKGLASVVAKLAIAGGLLGYVFSRVDPHAVYRIVASADLGLLLLTVPVLAFSYLLGGLRWWCVIRGLGRSAPLPVLIGLFWIGGFVGQVVPNLLGDAARISIAIRRGIPLGTAVFSAVCERLAMVVLLVILIAITAPLLDDRLGTAAPLWLALAMMVAGGAGITLLLVADRFSIFLRRFRVLAPLSSLSSGFRVLVLSRWLAPVMAIAALAHLDLIVAAAVLGNALRLPLSLLDYLVVMPVATLAMVLPISIGGWGVREGVLVAILGAMGIPAQTALAFSVMFGLAIIVGSLPAIPIWLLLGGGVRPSTPPTERDPF